jgi:CheY-like chemotaxis protein
MDLRELVKPNPEEEKETAEAAEGSLKSEDKSGSATEGDENMDWVLKNYDAKSSDPQSLEEELARLQTLRSYLILDSEREFPFERLTALAGRILDVPIALVSLVDLGRQWFMSNRGLGDVRETPRDLAFCAHAILSKNDIFIINDATKDPRFKDNPLVTGAPHIRFYAGAPLIAPEGYKLGTFCVIDTKTHPEGLDLDSKQNLRELSALAVDVLVARRKKRERETEMNSQLIACSAHDLLTPLSGIELSLSLMKDDQDLLKKVSQKHKDGMTQASKCSDILQQICRNVQATFTETKSAFEHAFSLSKPDAVKIDELVQRLYSFLEPLSKKVPVEIVIDKDVPKEIISDGSKIFRCAVNYLIVACTRTQKGMVKMTFSVEKQTVHKRPSLVVKCEDTGPAVDLEAYEYLFKPVSANLLSEKASNDEDEGHVSLELTLFSVACQMDVIGGEFGFRPRKVEGGGIESNGTCGTGSVFWFSIPFNEPVAKKEKKRKLTTTKQSIALSHADASRFHGAISSMIGGSSEKTITRNQVVRRQKRALIIEDSDLVRTMLVKTLTKMGFDVIEAENGMAGLEELKNSLFDITLCDFLMPIMDGLDCIQQYRHWEKIHRPWFNQRIVGISAHASESDIYKGREAGMHDFRQKPVTAKELTELLSSDDQIVTSKRLDSIESASDDEEDGEEPQQKRLKSSSQTTKSPGQLHNCLILSPPSPSIHIEIIQQTIKKCGWQSTTAQSDGDAWTLLKMRTWDIVLVDDAFAEFVEEFRGWESKKRSDRQGNMVLMIESLDQTGSAKSIILPDGLDMVIGKPVCLDNLRRMLRDT